MSAVATASSPASRLGPEPLGGTGSSVALLFPGQGSQTMDMRETVAAHRPDLLEAAIVAVGSDPFERIDEGTDFAQPALYAAALASWERAGRPRADLYAGHSLGELAALAVAGAVGEQDGLRLAVRRGAIMRRVAEEAPEGGMLALLGDTAAAESLAQRHGLALANRNGAGQTVVSGPVEALEAARAEARGRGLRAMRLPVRGAFHSPAMRPAVAEFRACLAEFAFTEPRRPVVSCTTAVPFEDCRRQLAEALVAPVRWQETLLALWSAGVRRFVEAGPGKVLTNLVRRGFDQVEAESLDSPRGGDA